FVWMWHGIVPKLAGPHADELAMLTASGVPDAWVRTVAFAVGAAEVALGIACLVFSRRRWPWILSIVLMAGATAGVLANVPHFATAAFNPITLNLLLAVVAAIGLLSLRDLPSARQCLRRAPLARGTEGPS